MTSQERHQARYLRRKAKREAKRAERMREFDNFDKVFSFEHLWKAYRKCVCGVGWKASTQKYRNTPISNIAYTYLRLKGGTYKSKGFYSFTIIERGKVRHIKAFTFQNGLCKDVFATSRLFRRSRRHSYTTMARV